MTRWLPLISSLLFVAAAGFLWMWHDTKGRLDRLEWEFHDPADAQLEAKAISLTAKYEGVPDQKIKDLLVPVTIHFPDRSCVELRPRWGVLGGTTVYCFRPSGELIERHQIGE